MDILIAAEELQSAPRLVREWVGALLASQMHLNPKTSEPAAAASLMALSVEEAGAILELIRSDHVVCEVFFELGRDTPRLPADPAGLHRMQFADMLHHTRLTDPADLMAALEVIDGAFQEVAPGRAATLFALDQAGGLYVDDTIRQSIKTLWQSIVTSQFSKLSETNPQGSSVPVGASPAGSPSA
jgi:hypothetical protein